MTNGYIVLTKGEPNLYKHAVESINLGKPIYFVDAENKTIYFGNTISLVGTDVVITADSATVTIENDNDVTITSTAPHLYRHEIKCDGVNFGLVGVIYTNFETVITNDNISSLLANKTIPMNAYNGDANNKIVSASLNVAVGSFKIGGIYYDANNDLTQSDDILGELSITFDAFSDTVSQIF